MFRVLSSPLKLNRKDLIEDKWSQTFILQRESDFKGFKIQILDSKGRALEEGTCEVLIDDAGSVDRLPMGGNGEMPFEFYGKEGLTITVNLYYMEEKYTQVFRVDDLKGNAILIFEDILSEESLKEQQYLQEKAEQEERVQTLIEEESKYNPRILLENSVEINTNIKGDSKTIKEWTDSLYAIFTNTNMYGALAIEGDEDYFSYDCEATGTYRISFVHKNLTKDDCGWVIDVLDKDGNLLLEEPLYSNWNQTEVKQSAFLEAGETYYVKVYHYNYSSADYMLKLENG